MVNNEIYGAFRKSYEPFTMDTTIKVIDELTNEIVEGLTQANLKSDDYIFQIILKDYEEHGVIPGWSLAIKATPKQGEQQ